MVTPGGLDPSLERAGTILNGRACVVALSGGRDSAALAWLAGRFGTSARAVHVDHNQPASGALRAAAERVAGQLGMGLVVVSVEVPPGPSFEHQARSVRYEALLGELAADEELLTGHTAHDNAETLLLNLARGAGTSGLAGIPMGRGRILRPLLEVSRDVARALVTTEGLGAIDDPTNEDTTYARNRIRHEVLPRLGSPVTIARAARLAAADDAVLEALASQVPHAVGNRKVSLPIGLLLAVPEPVAGRAIRRGLRIVKPPYPGTSRMVEAVWSVARGAAPRIELGEGLIAYRSSASVVVELIGRPAPEPTVLVAGRVAFGDWVLSAVERHGTPDAYPLGPGVAVFADPPELVVRAAAASDRVPMRGGGRKEITDVFSEAGIPRDRRRTWPVVASEDHVWWVPGVRRGWLGWGDSPSGRYLVANILQEG